MSNPNEKIPVIASQPSRPNPNCYWVTENLIAGEYPGAVGGEEESRDKLRKYIDCGVDFFVDLTEEGEKVPYQQLVKEEAMKANARVRYRRLPVEDFGTPSKGEMKQILDTIDAAIAEGRTVYVHCRGGIGRTGTTVGCYLARHGYNGEEALVTVNRLFQNSDRSLMSSSSPETRAQMAMVAQWEG